ncbi:MAG: C4-type zinc ribbon domain-containing protein [Elusimicrobiota bacterium]|jgi:predicted  nucleic acid-binding Zn-ribbon protein|nr:C4-type zinc ribbon domain-containing protein [Elusimicrobiota bacterium]
MSLKEDLSALEELQFFDDKIENFNKMIKAAPIEIEKKNKELEGKKNEVDALKRDFVSVSSYIKEQEALLAQKEQSISKFNVELNSAKTNEIYSSLMLQINKAKADISAIEDKILEFLEKTDDKSIALKNAEKELKEFEIQIKKDISQIQDNAENAAKEIVFVEKSRTEHKEKISKAVLEQYERIRGGRHSQGLAYIEKGSCSVCGMVLRPQLINQAQKFTDLVYCDGCSRILFYK